MFVFNFIASAAYLVAAFVVDDIVTRYIAIGISCPMFFFVLLEACFLFGRYKKICTGCVFCILGLI